MAKRVLDLTGLPGIDPQRIVEEILRAGRDLVVSWRSRRPGAGRSAPGSGSRWPTWPTGASCCSATWVRALHVPNMHSMSPTRDRTSPTSL